MWKNHRQVEMLIKINLITHSLNSRSIQDRGGLALHKIKLTAAKIHHRELKDYYLEQELEDNSIRSLQLLPIITRDLTICSRLLISIKEVTACQLKKQRTQMQKKKIHLQLARKTQMNLKIQE
jgi:hypothetical protein